MMQGKPLKSFIYLKLILRKENAALIPKRPLTRGKLLDGGNHLQLTYNYRLDDPLKYGQMDSTEIQIC